MEEILFHLEMGRSVGLTNSTFSWKFATERREPRKDSRGRYYSLAWSVQCV